MGVTTLKQAAGAVATAASASGSPVAAAAAGAGQPPGSARTGFQDLLASMQAKAGAGGAKAAAATAAGQDATQTADGTEDRFLKLLVAQMKNQDPLNPLDNSQVTTQLAQINTVRGIEKLNESMSALLDRTGGASTTEAAGLVGRRVLVEGDGLDLKKDEVARGGFELASDAASVRVEVLDAGGKVVDTQLMSNLSAGLHAFEWDGKVGERTLDPGAYRLRVAATGTSGEVAATVFQAVPVQAVTRGADGAPVLQLGRAGSTPLDQVRGVL